MAILFCDGCDSYAATSDLTKKWLTANTPWVYNATAGRNGGGALRAATTSAGVLKPVSSSFTANQIVAHGFWIKISAAPAAQASLINYRAVNQSVSCLIAVTATGKLAICNFIGNAIVTGSVNVCDNAWHWIELYTTTSSASATCKMFVDGVTEYNTIVNPAAGASVVDSWEFLSILNVTITLDDVIVYDDSTGAPTTSACPLGARQITTVRPQADGVVGFATATGGSTHYNQVNETVADGDTTYVESSSSSDQDLYDFAALGVTPTSITAVVANAFVENPNPGVINFKQICKSSSTQTDGTSIVAPASYLNKQQPFPLDPNTAAAWANATAVDAATFGIKVV